MSMLPYDIQSLFASDKSKPDDVPKVGSQSPPLPNVNFAQSSHLVAFVRHCGCPFAEKELHSLAASQTQAPDVRIVVVTHSTQQVTDDWFDKVGKPRFIHPERITVLGDPEYSLYNRFGIGQLPWSGIFNIQVLSSVFSLASEGIKNTKTGQGSNRWLNSGGFAVDHGGVVRWVKVAKDVSDTCDYLEALQTVL